MNKKTGLRWLAVLLAYTVLCTVMPVKAFAAEESAYSVSAVPLGEGTAEEPYQIGTAEQLRWFADKVNTSANKSTSTFCAELTADIDLGGQEWIPIGCYDSYSNYVYYGGIFDGCNRTVSGLRINSSKQYRAMFGYLKGATVKNLTVRGEVESTAASSFYAAGIVAYGSPVTIENCTNDVNVTTTAKGYAAGIAAGISGSSVTGCINNGEIRACGDYVGGIVGTATGGARIQNCFNNGNITNTGMPSSYAYSTGGIAGGISSSSSAVSVITMCGNAGVVTSTLKRTGGIVGSLGGTVEKCFNTAEVTGTYGVGGIAGDSGYNASTIKACYNTGEVNGITPAAEFTDANAKGVGGIIGGAASNTYKVFLSDCYQTGKVALNTGLTDVLSGGIIGDSSGKNYSGVETAGLATAQNCYYLDSCAVQGDGRNAETAGVTAKSDTEMTASGFAALLGEDYINSIEGSYPLLGWQDPEAKYAVHFVIEPSAAVLSVRNADGQQIEPDSGNTYLLGNGTYSYTVSGDECEEVNDSFIVAYGAQTINVSLKVKTYDFVFHIEPENAALEVAGKKPLADGFTYRLAKVGNPYTYTVHAFGYETQEGAVQVTGDRNKDKCETVLTQKPRYVVSIPWVREEGGAEGEVNIQVICTDYPTVEISAQEDGTFVLPDGEYTYSVFCAGYKTVKNEFTVNGKNLTLPRAELQIQTCWDGETVTEPIKNSEEVYQITGPNELVWFMKNAPLTASAELTADVRINEEILEGVAAPYVWSPVGTSSSKAYIGDFNGNGHTVSGIYVDGKTASNGGLFGYVGAGGSIHDLTLSDSVVIGNGNYYGGIAGDLNGKVSNCHVTDTVSVTGKAYVGGIVGELDNTGEVSTSSNAGKINAAAASGYVGGIAGRVYSSASNALIDCVNTGNISGLSYVGGIAGVVYNGGTISDVYSTGNVTAMAASTGTAGGLVGSLRKGTIKNAYVVGNISAARAGGVIGYMEAAAQVKALNQVYYLTGIADEVTGYENGCTIQGGAKPCTSDELKNMADALGDKYSENDSELNGGYPLLFWQIGKSVVNPEAPVPDPEGWNGKTASTAPIQIEGVYQISTPAEFKWFARSAKHMPDIEGILMKDIDLNWQDWTMIGGLTADTAFTGVLDGNSHTVENLYIGTGSVAALFGFNAGMVRNLTVEGIVCSADNSSAVAVYNSGTISGVTTAVFVKGGNHIAGISAYNEKEGVISDCFNSSSITGEQYVAGITSSNKGKVTNCGNSGAVTAEGTFAAGVVADNNGGTVENSANSGQIIGKAAVQYAYVGGVIGRNDGTAKKLYNSGNIVGLGSCVGGCVAINTSGSAAHGLYNVGDVCGSYIDTADGEDFRVGGAVGEVVSGVSDAYTMDTLEVQCGGTLATAEEIAGKAGELAGMLPAKSPMQGTVTLGNMQAGDEAKAEYTGTAGNPIFVWYCSDGVDETVLSVSETYVVPVHMVGRALYVKVMDSSFSGIISGKTEKIDGFTGSVQINGYAVIGHTLTAEYKGDEESPVYQWYRGTNAIEGADKAFYTLTESDLGKTLSIRVTGQKPGHVERKTGIVQSEEEAGIWPDDETEEPVKISDTYVITSEAELRWFASRVNGGNTHINGKLAENITLTADNWYPIGSARYPYIGTFDGNKKTVSGINIKSVSNEQGFFGNIGGKGEVKGVSISGTILADKAGSVGGIAGYIDGKVSRCSFAGIIQGAEDVGGIVGQVGLNSKVSQCINTGKVWGNQNVGGIAGSVSYGTVSECINIGAVGSEDITVNAGGIAGYMTNYAVITACWNKGGITGKSKLGGIAGDASVCAAPQGCYNIGTVGPGLYAYGVLGGLTGTDYISGTQGSFYLAESAAEATDKTAQGLSSESMKKAGFVTLLNAQAGNSFFVMDVKEKNAGYPLLLWQTGKEDTGEGTENPEEPESLTVTFTLCGDTAHGPNTGHIACTEWIGTETCTLPNGSTAYDLFKKMMKDYGFAYTANGNSYISSITGPDKVELSEFTNGTFSGWMYTINDEFPDYMDTVKLKNGDKMRFFYTDDYRQTGWKPNDATVKAVEELISDIDEQVTLKSEEKIETARDAYNMLNESQKWNVSNYNVLVEAEKELARLKAGEEDILSVEKVESLIADIVLPVTLESEEPVLAARAAYNSLTENQKLLVSNYAVLTEAENILAVLKGSHKEVIPFLNATADYMVSLGTPQVGSVGGDWMVLGLARSGRKAAVDYYKNVWEYVRENIDEQGRLHKVKSTENSRIILALTSEGYDVTHVGGYNLLEGLADLNYVKGQGINGLIWALIALDSHNYEIPTGSVTREKLIWAILEEQQKNGGWSLDGSTVEPDITAMAVQALAPYYNRDEKVKVAVDNAVSCLSAIQLPDGGYGNSYETKGASAESCAQVVVALTALGIEPHTDMRFIKNGTSVIDALCSFAVEGGGFRHKAGGERNGMATEQSYYALAAYQRLLEGKTGLYDMSDVDIRKAGQEAEHIWDDGEVTAPTTCGKDGVKTFTCMLCGKTRAEVIKATGMHVWDDGTITQKATYTEMGNKKYTCRICKKAQKNETIPMMELTQVKGLKVKAKSVIEMTLSWKKVKGAESYTVQLKNGKGKWKKAKTVLTGEKAVVTGLKPGTAYAFRVRAEVKGISGAYSRATTLRRTKEAKALKKPAAVSAKYLKAETGEPGRITMTWRHVKDASGYIIRWSADGKKWKSKKVAAHRTSYVLRGLKKHRKYHIQIAAKNKKGVSRYTEIVVKTKKKK